MVGVGELGLAVRPSLERKETNEAAMSLEISQIKPESDFAYCRFRGARKWRPASFTAFGGEGGLVGPERVRGRAVMPHGVVRAQPGL